MWHQELIEKLPREQLLGQHRECCALRGKGWGKKHSTVDYVFKYKIERLVSFHKVVMEEMEKRGYNVSSEWFDCYYRGKSFGYDYSLSPEIVDDIYKSKQLIYLEHDKAYLKECIENLRKKGVVCRYFE